MTEGPARDAWLICAAALLRSTTVGLVGVVLAIYLGAEGLSVAETGLVIGVGLAGSAVMTAIVSVAADRFGRRRTLILASLLMAFGYVALVISHRMSTLLPAAFFGMLNGMGRDRGPAGPLEQAMLPETVSPDRRTWMLAWYNVTMDTGHALGAIAALIPTMFARHLRIGMGAAHQLTFLLCGGAMLVALVPYAMISAEVEIPRTLNSRTLAPIDARTKAIVAKLAVLFGLDSIGGGFLSSALIAYWFFQRYGLSETQLAGLFFVARGLNAVSHVGAAWMAERIGLLNTMVLTHLPSSVLLMLAPAAPSATIASGLFLGREALVEMDVPTRQSYVMAIVPPQARSFASGVTNLVRTIGWAAGPSIAGVVMQHVVLGGPLLIGGALKMTYDVLLYRSFRRLRPSEEV